MHIEKILMKTPLIQRVDYVCPQKKPCSQHEFLNWYLNFFKTMQENIEDWKIYCKYVYFEKGQDCNSLFDWTFTWCQRLDLEHLSYSERLRYLK